MEVIEGCDLTGKLAVITGGYAGLGKHTALALGLAGADLFIGARSNDALEAAKRDLLAAGVRQVHVHRLDLCSPESVLSFSEAVNELARPIDFLVANAGVMASPLYRDERGNEFQLSTNYLGHALLASRLAKAVASAGGGRVVSLSSTGHHYSAVRLDDLNFERRTYDKWEAYGQSKTASSLLAVKIGKDMARAGVSGFAVHPGMIPTDLAKYLTPQDFEETRVKLGEYADRLPPFKTLETGAATSVWAATSPKLDGRTFAYCEDCEVAPLIDTPNFGSGVLAYATDAEIADKLWVAAEGLLGQPLPLLA
jgi:NAD(P)-dependent dehydrogenase (short-subunit alcohol dehydrogenase family)